MFCCPRRPDGRGPPSRHSGWGTLRGDGARTDPASAVTCQSARGGGGIRMQFTGSPKQQAEETVTSAAPETPPGAPSWASVLVTTIRLWVAADFRRSRRPLLIAICVLVVAAVVVILRFTGTSSWTARVPASGGAQQSLAHQSQPPHGSARPSGGITAVRSQAAAWIAGQLGGDETIACDPSMCTTLGAHGVASSRLVSLPPSASGVPGTDVIVTSASGHAWLSQDAPALLASFGSGAHLIEVRAISGGRARRLPGDASFRPSRSPVRGRATDTEPAYRDQRPGRRAAQGRRGGFPSAGDARAAGVAALVAGDYLR